LRAQREPHGGNTGERRKKRGSSSLTSPRKNERSDGNCIGLGRLRRRCRCLLVLLAVPLRLGGSEERVELPDFRLGHRFPDVQTACKVPLLAGLSLVVLIREDRRELLVPEVERVRSIGIERHETLVRILKELLYIPEKPAGRIPRNGTEHGPFQFGTREKVSFG